MLKPSQTKCIEMLMQGDKTQVQIARELNITEQTICGWKKEPDFAAELAKANRVLINSLVPRAINKTAALLDAESEQVQLAAAKDILDRAGYKPPKEAKPDNSEQLDKLDAILFEIKMEAERSVNGIDTAAAELEE